MQWQPSEARHDSHSLERLKQCPSNWLIVASGNVTHQRTNKKNELFQQTTLTCPDDSICPIIEIRLSKFLPLFECFTWLHSFNIDCIYYWSSRKRRKLNLKEKTKTFVSPHFLDELANDFLRAYLICLIISMEELKVNTSLTYLEWKKKKRRKLAHFFRTKTDLS